MKKNFGFDTEFNKLLLIARSLWMGFGRGEGELEIENQGRFERSISNVFSQETVAIGQHTPRIGEHRPKLRFTPDTQVLARVSSAGCTLNSDSTPHFFSHGKKAENSFFREGADSSSLREEKLKLNPSSDEGAFQAIAENLQNQLNKLLKISKEDS